MFCWLFPNLDVTRSERKVCKSGEKVDVCLKEWKEKERWREGWKKNEKKKIEEWKLFGDRKKVVWSGGGWLAAGSDLLP